jgi:AcrR family transcriptional regulator
MQDQGTVPTVAGVARLAGVSRATAYRYFPTQQALLVEIAVGPAMAPVEAALGEHETEDVARRLSRLVESSAASVLAREADMHRAVWGYQDT